MEISCKEKLVVPVSRLKMSHLIMKVIHAFHKETSSLTEVGLGVENCFIFFFLSFPERFLFYSYSLFRVEDMDKDEV